MAHCVLCAALELRVELRAAELTTEVAARAKLRAKNLRHDSAIARRATTAAGAVSGSTLVSMPTTARAVAHTVSTAAVGGGWIVSHRLDREQL